MKRSSISLRLSVRGCPPSIASITMPNVVSSGVCANRLFSTTPEIASRLSSITIRMPCRSDSSRMSLMPSIFFSRTSSAICSISRALFTWYGISVTMMLSRSVFFATSISVRARIVICPRPVS